MLITIIKEYMILQGSVTMEGCTPPASKYLRLARIQDQLGWDCFVEGRIPILLIKTVCPFLHDWSPRRHIVRWGVAFIKSLLSVTHKQYKLAF
jgi:hypothetical protein